VTANVANTYGTGSNALDDGGTMMGVTLVSLDDHGELVLKHQS
jgi:hypothetical protein